MKTSNANQLIDIETMCKLVNRKRTSLYVWVRDGKFPKPLMIGKRTLGWTESQYKEWAECSGFIDPRVCEYGINGYRSFKMPDWTKSLNKNALMSSIEVAKIVGVTPVDIKRLVNDGLFHPADVTNTKWADNGNSCRWSVGLLRTLENKDNK